jgi:hypothetical protein
MKKMAVQPGTKLDRRGALLLFCQCHGVPSGEIMAEVYQGLLTIERRYLGVQHYVVLGPDILGSLARARRIPCVCCAADDPQVLAECRDNLLLIRCTRHQKGHFLALAAPTLRGLLAP